MKNICSICILIGLISCSTEVSKNEEANLDSNHHDESEKKPLVDIVSYREVVLFENSLDTFSLPLSENYQFRSLQEYYHPYWVEGNIGRQDGPDFVYIDIRIDDKTPILYLNFKWEDESQLDDIRIVDSSVKDQYGVRVGDAYQEILEKRNEEFNHTIDAHHLHLYLSTENSNIYYELTGEISISEEDIENPDSIELTDDELQKCKVKQIIWRKKN